MDQGPASQTQFASLRRAVEMLGAMQMVIEPARAGPPSYTLSGNFMRPLRYIEDCRRS